MLVDKGFDINASDVFGSTPLIACMLQNIEKKHQIQYFDRFRKGRYSKDDCHESNALYHTYMTYANRTHWELEYKHPSENHYKIIQLLIENGADINKADKKGRIPLYLASEIGEMKLIQLLKNNTSGIACIWPIDE
ncbi:Hypothetical predicted protein [Mytilus galloprovincialis]|uniref:Uncharacterized protein n=1 Tax=Mytilus galloprovincialis TaxID=29158 RepID=A0A8B6F8B4_MYTGA|nr:Hypothetical predicted protein [Mytilus galloprovincialis]